MSGTLNEQEDPPSGAEKPWIQANSAHRIQDLEVKKWIMNQSLVMC